MDVHQSPLQDFVSMLQALGVEVEIKNHIGGSGVAGVSGRNMYDACQNWRTSRKDFFEQNKNNPKMQDIDAFFCSMPPSVCQMYMPFNKTIISILPIPLDYARENPNLWFEWLEDYKRMAQNPKNIFIANNRYHQLYVKYFLNLDIPLIPSLTIYAQEGQGNIITEPSRKEILLGGNFLVPGVMGFIGKVNQFIENKKRANPKTPLAQTTMTYTKALYQPYKFNDLRNHQVIVNVPYCNSVMSYFEYYRLNIPMFFPSRELRDKWESKADNIYDIRHRVYWRYAPLLPKGFGTKIHFSGGSGINLEQFRSDFGQAFLPHSPNDYENPEAVRYWSSLSDYYDYFPHVQYYDSEEDLVEKLEKTNFKEIQQKMQKSNEKMISEINKDWIAILTKTFNKFPAKQSKIPAQFNYEQAMQKLWGYIPFKDHDQCDKCARATSPPTPTSPRQLKMGEAGCQLKTESTF